MPNFYACVPPPPVLCSSSGARRASLDVVCPPSRLYLLPGRSIELLESATGLIETRTADATGRQLSFYDHLNNRLSMWMRQFAAERRKLKRINNR
jgi:hypothetical protein